MENLLRNLKNLTLQELSRFWLSINSALPGGMPPDTKVDSLVLSFGNLETREKQVIKRKTVRMIQMMVDSTENPPA